MVRLRRNFLAAARGNALGRGALSCGPMLQRAGQYFWGYKRFSAGCKLLEHVNTVMLKLLSLRLVVR